MYPFIAVVALVSVLLFWTTASAAQAAASVADVEREPSPFGKRRVLIIGLDGVRVDSLKASDTPNIDTLAQSGPYTYEALASRGEQATSSGPSWASILTGVWAKKHKAFDNDFETPNFDRYPHFYRRIRDTYPSAYLSSIVNWAPSTRTFSGTDASSVAACRMRPRPRKR